MLIVGHDRASGQPLVVGDEFHCLVLGPPRSGKTTGKLAPSILTHRGPVVVASSKPDILQLTLEQRLQDGPIWIFSLLPVNLPADSPIRVAAWSPLPGCANWDTALLRARSLTTAEARAADDETSRFFRTQAERVLAALLHAAALAGYVMEDVARWLLLADLTEPLELLQRGGATWPVALLRGLTDTDPRLRDSILVTASDTLRVFDSERARRQADGQLVNIQQFLETNGTIYIIAPADVQQLFAPLIVGFLDDIRRTTFARYDGQRTVLCVLDEADKIAPWPGLPSVLGEGGSQGFQLMVCFQDLSQARARWGPATDGFATLFRHKVLLGGIADKATLEGFSAVLGEENVPGASQTVTRPLWPPHRLAAPPAGTAIHIDGVSAGLVKITRMHDVGGTR